MFVTYKLCTYVCIYAWMCVYRFMYAFYLLFVCICTVCMDAWSTVGKAGCMNLSIYLCLLYTM